MRRATPRQTRIFRNAIAPAEAELSLAERVALFSSAISGPRAADLVAGFASGPRELASSQVKRALRWDSATRQARVTHEFGARRDQFEALKRLMAECAPALRAVVFTCLAPWQQALLPSPVSSGLQPDTSPALRALAERLVREATR